MLQTAATTPDAGGMGSYSGILMMVLIFVVFYFFMIRPQTKSQKEIKKQREAMQPGDKVVTSGGIYGKVKEIKESTVLVEIADNVRIKVDINSVFASADAAQTEVK
jgi:preprotein translocase subunit YajC